MFTDNLSPLMQQLVLTVDLSAPLRLSTKNMRVILSNPATILFVDGKKYVAKAHNEEFDEEKGLLMCLAKAAGISHLDLKRLLKKATRPNDKKMTEANNAKTTNNDTKN